MRVDAERRILAKPGLSACVSDSQEVVIWGRLRTRKQQRRGGKSGSGKIRSFDIRLRGLEDRPSCNVGACFADGGEEWGAASGSVASDRRKAPVLALMATVSNKGELYFTVRAETACSWANATSVLPRDGIFRDLDFALSPDTLPPLAHAWIMPPKKAPSCATHIDDVGVLLVSAEDGALGVLVNNFVPFDTDISWDKGIPAEPLAPLPTVSWWEGPPSTEGPIVAWDARDMMLAEKRDGGGALVFCATRSSAYVVRASPSSDATSAFRTLSRFSESLEWIDVAIRSRTSVERGEPVLELSLAALVVPKRKRPRSSSSSSSSSSTRTGALPELWVTDFRPETEWWRDGDINNNVGAILETFAPRDGPTPAFGSGSDERTEAPPSSFALCAGEDHLACLTPHGEVWQCERFDNEWSDTGVLPPSNQSDMTFNEIASSEGAEHILAVRENMGHVFAWGNNSFQVSDVFTSGYERPVVSRRRGLLLMTDVLTKAAATKIVSHSEKN